jgi:hypothetical protein
MSTRLPSWSGIVSGLVLSFGLSIADAQQPAPATVDSLAFLVGKWVGEGSTGGGAGSGYASFEVSLKGKALVRKNHAEYPATKDRAAAVHEDLMIVYVDAATSRLRAFYTDSEGNTINYLVTPSADGKTVVFQSEPQTVGPRYRLTYTRAQPDRIALTFEMAPADQPDRFTKFMDGNMRKSGG